MKPIKSSHENGIVAGTSLQQDHTQDETIVQEYVFYVLFQNPTRSQAVAKIADRTAKNCVGHVT